MRISPLFLSILCLFTLTHCEPYDFARRVVQQGNLLPQSKIHRLKIGMSKEEVAILMGNSLLTPLFNRDRWDYAYTWRRGTGPMRVCNARLYFSNNALKRVEQIPCH